MPKLTVDGEISFDEGKTDIQIPDNYFSNKIVIKGKLKAMLSYSANAHGSGITISGTVIELICNGESLGSIVYKKEHGIKNQKIDITPHVKPNQVNTVEMRVVVSNFLVSCSAKILISDDLQQLFVRNYPVPSGVSDEGFDEIWSFELG